MKKLNIDFLNKSITVILIGLLSGCSCEKVPEIKEESSRAAEEIHITDPTVDSEFTSDKESQSTSKAATKSSKIKSKKETTKSSKQQNKKSIPYEKYDPSSYTDLEFVECDSANWKDQNYKYQILREGPSDAEMPKKGQTVVTHYVCWHDDNGKPGTLVDNSYERGEPFEFKIGYGYVIRGWDEALSEMRIGDKRRLYIPSEMAFGQAGATELVPGDTDLIYEVEIIDIKE